MENKFSTALNKVTRSNALNTTLIADNNGALILKGWKPCEGIVYNLCDPLSKLTRYPSATELSEK